MKQKIFILLLSCFATGMLVAQTGGGISLVAVGDASPVILDHVEKISDPARTKDTTLPPPAFNYALTEKQFPTTVKPDTIQAAKIGRETVPHLYKTYARLGVGNYASFMGEFYMNSVRSKNGAWGIHLRHFSAGSGPKDVQGEYSGFSRQDVNLFGKKFMRHYTLDGNLDFDRHVVYNYGSVQPDAYITKGYEKQFFNYYGAHAGLESHYTDSAMINHKIGLQFYQLDDRFKTKENNFLLTATAGRFIRTEYLGADAGVDYNNDADTLNKASNTIVKFVPRFSAHGDRFDAMIGMGIYIDAGNQSHTYFYPQASFSYNIFSNIIIPYITLSGSDERNSYRSLSLVNPFMMSSQSLSLMNTQHKYDFGAGLRGSLSSEIVYDLRASRVQLVNAPFFVNTPVVPDPRMDPANHDPLANKFLVVYDNVSVAQVHGQLGWQHHEKIRLVLTGDWYKFSMTNESQPWHTPNLKVSLTGEYNLQDKIIARIEAYYMDSRYAKVIDGSTSTTVTLKPVTDINIGFEYRYTKYLSIFLNANNVLSKRYDLWYAYPLQKLNVLGGLTYTF